MKWISLILTVSCVAATPLHHEAPLFSATTAKHVPDAYIVMLKPQANLMVHTAWLTTFLAASSSDSDTRIHHVYPVWNGYSGQWNAETLHSLRSHPDAS
jgi:hypothetical protein